jgi:hypothetical protein
VFAGEHEHAGVVPTLERGGDVLLLAFSTAHPPARIAARADNTHPLPGGPTRRLVSERAARRQRSSGQWTA